MSYYDDVTIIVMSVIARQDIYVMPPVPAHTPYAGSYARLK